ncbi:MAG: hypothetical protein JW838_01800 [Spirochaetes bacterium]|nr:hypothetical protein [Spirochaetota bacterium]
MRAYSSRIISIAICSLIALVLGFVAAEPAQSKIITNVPADVSGDEELAVVIEDFEAAEVSDKGWKIESMPKQFTKAETEERLKMKNPVPRMEMKVVAGAPNDMNVEEWSLTGLGKKKEKILGVSYRFRYPGTNEIHIIPPLEVDWKDRNPVMSYNASTGKEEQERAIQLPGQAKAISLWVHGRGHPYDLELWLKDHTGATHVLKFGSVNFVGWRPLSVQIPGNIPQTYMSYPQTRVTKITRFVLRAVPNAPRGELMEVAYFFFDQLKVLTSTYEVNFDGSDLHKIFDGGEKKQ